jgi:hypothetical protein
MTQHDGQTVDRGLIVLSGGGVSLIVDATPPGLPCVLHWGADVGLLDEQTRANVALALLDDRRSGPGQTRRR